MTHAITLQVLYDDVMTKRIGNLTKDVIGSQDKKNPLLFGDIDGRPLVFPSMIFPFRRIIYFVSKQYYQTAMKSSRSHTCASNSCPTDENWDIILNAVKEESLGFAGSSVCTA